jgi:hypothetical protein
VSARVLASPATEIRRLRAECDGLRRLAAALVNAIDPEAEVAYRHAMWRDGWDACLDRFADLIGGRVYPAHPTEIERLRHHVCCGPCRWGGHRAGCERCEDRIRQTFSQPHPDDYIGGGVAA